MNSKLAYRLERLADWDRLLCVRVNRISHRTWPRALFRVVSRLGDGVFWYALMLALLLYLHESAVTPVLHMIAVGLVCGAVYKLLKGSTARPRPYQVHSDVTLCAAPLDQFSFPSGHTLHAVGFGMVALAYFPWLAWIVVPFIALVAASRVVLGLHYPSDVLVGALIGALIAGLSLSF